MLSDELTAQILHMARDQRIPPSEIRERIKPRANIYHIYAVIESARRRGEDIPAFPRYASATRHDPRTCIVMDPETLTLVNSAAQKRGCTPAELASELLHTITDDNLFSAILDDGVP